MPFDQQCTPFVAVCRWSVQQAVQRKIDRKSQSRRLGLALVWFPVHIERKVRQGVESPGNVQEPRVGVHVRGQARVGMPHRGLSRPQRHASLAQERAERRPQGMDVEGASAIVALRDSGELQVSIEDPDESSRNGEDRTVAGQSARDRLRPFAGFRLECSELIGEPGSEVFRQIGPDHNAVAFAVLLVVGVKLDVGNRPIEPELSDGQGRQFVLPESGQNERLVDEGSLSPQRFELRPDLGTELGDRLPLPLAAVNRSLR